MNDSRGSAVRYRVSLFRGVWGGHHRLALTPRSLEIGDLIILLSGQLPPGEQAAAIPPDFPVSPSQEQSVLPALLVGLEVAYVSARCR